MSYRLTIYFSDGGSEEIDELFETERDAKNELAIWLDSWENGKETLKLAGENYVNASIDGYDIDEV